jgi:hypothetical protein
VTVVAPVPATVIVSGRASAPIAIVTVFPEPRSSSVMSPAALVVKFRSGWPNAASMSSIR